MLELSIRDVILPAGKNCCSGTRIQLPTIPTMYFQIPSELNTIRSKSLRIQAILAYFLFAFDVIYSTYMFEGNFNINKN